MTTGFGEDLLNSQHLLQQRPPFLFLPVVFVSSQGEKYLILRKKYRHLLTERDAKHHETDGGQQSPALPMAAAATAQWEVTDATSRQLPPARDTQDEPTSCGEPDVSLKKIK